MARKHRYGLALLLLVALCLIPALSFAQTGTQQDAAETHSYQSDVVQFTGNITIKPDEIIRGNVVAMSGNIDVEGKVYGNVTAMAGNIRLHSGSLVTGNVTAIAGAIEREDSASISGRITSRQEIRDMGDSRYHYNPYPFPYDYRYNFHYPSPWKRFSGWLLSLLGLLTLTAASVAVFPDKLKNMKNGMEAEPLRQLGIGLLGWVVLPVVLLALTITIIGIPVVFLLLLCLPIIVIIGFVVMAMFAGQQLDKAFGDRWPRFMDDRPIIQALKGMLLIWIIKAIPLAGWLVWPLAALFGMGTALATRFGTNRPWFKSKNGENRTEANTTALPDTVDTAQPEEPCRPDGTEEQSPAETAEGREINDHGKEE
ncbi:MAG TPA: polymer-forming cytoskeletal protein [Syntrophaceticus sp.]|jgi:hypothetical protein|nr:polymer-forming cytoskeletal protein [Syntrophaceticus schinkii]MDD4262472.1 polymer-forming cytoskeletal protein [Syntrophaceticus schinkii]MDD4675846.1 polymer-forming cytoskeletal protein [Syntrophaceticus schinkii]HHY31272.1 polymer-forming cytoskeletal protein [Syntrophaceticus sp.]